MSSPSVCMSDTLGSPNRSGTIKFQRSHVGKVTIAASTIWTNVANKILSRKCIGGPLRGNERLKQFLLSNSPILNAERASRGVQEIRFAAPGVSKKSASAKRPNRRGYAVVQGLYWFCPMIVLRDQGSRSKSRDSAFH